MSFISDEYLAESVSIAFAITVGEAATVESPLETSLVWRSGLLEASARAVEML